MNPALLFESGMVENHGELVIWDQGNPSLVEFFQRKINRCHFLVLRGTYSGWRFKREQDPVGEGAMGRRGLLNNLERGAGQGSSTQLGGRLRKGKGVSWWTFRYGVDI